MKRSLAAGELTPLRTPLGSMRAIAAIRKPERSFEDWKRFLAECDEAGISGVTERGSFMTELGMALYRRWNWMKWSEERGLSFEAADAAWNYYGGHLPRRGPNAAPAAQDGQGTDLLAYAEEAGLT